MHIKQFYIHTIQIAIYEQAQRVLGMQAPLRVDVKKFSRLAYICEVKGGKKAKSNCFASFLQFVSCLVTGVFSLERFRSK